MPLTATSRSSIGQNGVVKDKNLVWWRHLASRIAKFSAQLDKKIGYSTMAGTALDELHPSDGDLL